MQVVKDTDGRPIMQDGEEKKIVLCVCLDSKEAQRLIRKSHGKVKIEESGQTTLLKDYSLASPDEIKAHLQNCENYQAARAGRIRKRQLRQSKHFVMVSPEEMGKATGTIPQMQETEESDIPEKEMAKTKRK